MPEEYLQESSEVTSQQTEQMYYYEQPPIDSFSAAMTRAHFAASGFHPHPIPYGSMPIMGHSGQPMVHPSHMDSERAAQDYYFQQVQHAEQYAHHQQQQLQAQQQVLMENSRNSSVQNQKDDSDGKYQCTMCERSFNR